MRKFSTEISRCHSEKQYNNIIYDRQSPYIPCDIDYKDDIQMLCIKGSMEVCVERENSYITYGYSVAAVGVGYYPLLEVCLDMDKANNRGHEISQSIIQKMNQEKEKLEALERTLDDVDDADALRELAFLQDNFIKNKEEKIRLENMLRDLDLCHHTFYLNDKVPQEMTPLIEKFVKNLYRILEIDAQPTVIPNEKQQRSKEREVAKKGVFVRDGVVILRDIHFDEAIQLSVLMEILEDRIPHISRALFLDHCCFDIPHQSFGALSEHSVMFKNCHFKQCFRWMGQANNTYLIFDDCVISDELEITLANTFGLYLNDCVFEKDSTLKLDWLGAEGSLYNISITDCVFHGGFELLRRKKLSLVMNNVTFYKPFIIKDTTFGEHTKISNLCFPSNTTDEIEASKKQLYDSLVESGLKEMAEELNLLGMNKRKKPDFNYEAYQIAYASGWLKPEYAAYFLGKSTNYLAKMRLADKKKIIRESIPHRTNGRDVQYPIDALMAFKAKDWNKLKELRKKYGYPAKT